eukprot:358811-Chlamydomonas_euryale.AAC.4
MALQRGRARTPRRSAATCCAAQPASARKFLDRLKATARTAVIMEMPTISQTGRCHCGAVEYKVDGQILFNGLCHCKDCAHARGSSPVHVLAVTPASGVQITKVRWCEGGDCPGFLQLVSLPGRHV